MWPGIAPNAWSPEPSGLASKKMKFFRRLAIRSIATANVAFALYGFFLFYTCLDSIGAIPESWQQLFPHTFPVLYFSLAVSAALLLLLTWGSIKLFRLSDEGFRTCSLAYGLEVLYWFLDAPLRWLLLWYPNETLAKYWTSIFANGLLGKGPIAPQIHTLYPGLALLVLLFAFRSLPWKNLRSPQ